jgi:transposase
MGYGHRWAAEAACSAFKRAFGEAVRARKFAGAVSELLIKAALHNLFISL